MPAVAHRPTKPKPSSVTTAGCGSGKGGYCQNPHALRPPPRGKRGDGSTVCSLQSYRGVLFRVEVLRVPQPARIEHTLSSVCSHAWPTFSAVSVRISCTSMFLSAGVCGVAAGFSASPPGTKQGPLVRLQLPGRRRVGDARFSRAECRGRATHLQRGQPGERRAGRLRAWKVRVSLLVSVSTAAPIVCCPTKKLCRPGDAPASKRAG